MAEVVGMVVVVTGAGTISVMVEVRGLTGTAAVVSALDHTEEENQLKMY